VSAAPRGSASHADDRLRASLAGELTLLGETRTARWAMPSLRSSTVASSRRRPPRRRCRDRRGPGHRRALAPSVVFWNCTY